MDSNFWKHLIIGRGDELLSLPDNSTNHSMDVITKNCFGDFDTVACVRSATLCLLNVITLVLCTLRIISLHLAGGQSVVYSNYIAFFCLASSQCMLGSVEWIFGWTKHAALASHYVRAVELIILCYMYTNMAFRLTRRPESTAARMSAAGLSLCLIYFTFFLVMAYVFQNAPWADCNANYWLFLSAGQLFLVQIIVLSSLLIMSKVNSVTFDQHLQRFRRRGLILLILALEFSTLFGLLYHLLILILTNEEISCSGLFKHKQLLYTPARMTYEIIVFLLPVWATFYVFMPMQKFEFDYEHIVASSYSATRSILRNPAILERRQRNLSPVTIGNVFSNYNDDDEHRLSVSYEVLFNEQGEHSNIRRRIFTRRRKIPRIMRGRSALKSKRSRSAPSLLKHVASPALETIPEEASGSGMSSGTVSPSMSGPLIIRRNCDTEIGAASPASEAQYCSM